MVIISNKGTEMFYDRNNLEDDLTRINFRYGKRTHQGFFTVTKSQIGKLAIDNSKQIDMGEGVTYDGVSIDFNQLEMSHPAAVQILALAVETDEYYRFSPLYGAS
jgi:hypothetical protein